MSAAEEMEKKAAPAPASPALDMRAPPGEMAGGMGALLAALAAGGEVYLNPTP